MSHLDDTITYAQGNTVLEIEVDMHSDVNNISAWLSSNKLTVNAHIGGTMLVGTRQKLQNAKHFSVTYKSKYIRRLC